MAMLLICDHCGSKEVQVQAWVDANTNEYKGETDSGQAWCERCEGPTKLKEIVIPNADDDE
jgi:Zn finger protein HypA/HybF involved in hydrogenase expression